MRLTPTERDRLLLFTAAELARSRMSRGLRLNIPEATALIADTVCEVARGGGRLAEAIDAGRSVLAPHQVLPGVADIVTQVEVEAVFDDGTQQRTEVEFFAGEGERIGNVGRRTAGQLFQPDRRLTFESNVAREAKQSRSRGATSGVIPEHWPSRVSCA